MPAGCINAGPKSVSPGNGQILACAAVLQPVSLILAATSEVVKAPLSSIVGGAITSEIPLPFTFALVPNLCVYLSRA